MVIADFLTRWRGEKIGPLPYIESTETHFRKLFLYVNTGPSIEGIYIIADTELGRQHIQLSPELLCMRMSVDYRQTESLFVQSAIFQRLISEMNTAIEQKCIEKLRAYENSGQSPRQGWINMFDCQFFERREGFNTMIDFSVNVSLGVSA